MVWLTLSPAPPYILLVVLFLGTILAIWFYMSLPIKPNDTQYIMPQVLFAINRILDRLLGCLGTSNSPIEQ
jgi:hypothetical protein